MGILIFHKFATCVLVSTESNTMARSLRSKWKRKMRAVKRVRYGEKENKVLDKMIKNTEDRKKILETVTESCKMLRCNIGNCTLKHGPQPLGEPSLDVVTTGDDKMDESGKPKVYSAKTKRDERGTYPAWMSKRKIQGLKTKPKNRTARLMDGSNGRIAKKRHGPKGKGRRK